MKHLFTQLLSWAARYYLNRTTPYIIGITGSVGKTTCRTIVVDMLQKFLPEIRIDTTPKNFNSQIGICFAILGITSYQPTFLTTLRVSIQALAIGCFGKKRAEIMVLEYGIDHPGDMDELLRIATPDMSIFTGIDLVHAAYFASPEDIFAEKIKLFYATRDIAFYGSSLGGLMGDIVCDADLLSFSLSAEGVDEDISFTQYGYRREDEQIGSSFVIYEGKDRICRMRTDLVGQEHAGYITLAYEISQIVAKRKGISFSGEKELVYNARLLPGRMTRMLGKRGSILLDSSYNASPSSMRMMIDLLTDIRQHLFPDRALVFCLGDMRELGASTEKEHRELATCLIHADHLFLLGDAMQAFLLPALDDLGFSSSRTQICSGSKELGDALENYLASQDRLALVLFKGSQNTIFLEEAIKVVLRYPSDAKKLCRQESRWIQKKV